MHRIVPSYLTRTARLLGLVAFAFIALFTQIHSAPPQRIQITRGLIQADPIAIHDYTAQDKTVSGDINNVIANDLKNCGLFAPIDASRFPQASAAMQEAGIEFEKWQAIRARFIVTINVVDAPAGIRIEFRLYDVLSKTKLIAQAVEGSRLKWRRLAHTAADLIYTRVTNEAGFFNTQIVYAEPHGQGRKSTTQLIIMDYDGHNPQTLTNSKHLVLTPRYSPSGKEVAYLKIHNHKAEVFLMNLANKHSRKLGDFEGMSYAPRFSPDGAHIVMSLSQQGRSAIYTMALKDRSLKRLTDHVSIDTSPCYSPDSTQIIFTSDRAGMEQLFMMNSIGGDVKRISFGDGKYSQPVWSPRGDLIAFTKQVRTAEGTRFYIGVMSIDGTGERMIADGWLVEDPCWAGNGRYLIFTKQESIRQKSKIYMVDLTGYNQQWISTRANASNGTWSPLTQVAAEAD